MKKMLLGFAFLFFLSIKAQENTSTYSLDLGIRCMKSVGFYWENGVSLEYKSTKVLNNKISIGFNFLTSTLGTDLFKKAIPTTHTELSIIKYFRNKKMLQPLLRLNFGYATARYDSEFKDLPNSSALASLEAGLKYKFPKNFNLLLGGGYNFIAGSGVKGLGTVFPFYGQFSILYTIR